MQITQTKTKVPSPKEKPMLENEKNSFSKKWMNNSRFVLAILRRIKKSHKIITNRWKILLDNNIFRKNKIACRRYLIILN